MHVWWRQREAFPATGLDLIVEGPPHQMVMEVLVLEVMEVWCSAALKGAFSTGHSEAKTHSSLWGPCFGQSLGVCTKTTGSLLVRLSDQRPPPLPLEPSEVVCRGGKAVESGGLRLWELFPQASRVNYWPQTGTCVTHRGKTWKGKSENRSGSRCSTESFVSYVPL